MITIAPNFTQRNYSWTAWKAAKVKKNFILQYQEEDNQYSIWAYDGPEAHICIIWKGDLHQSVIDAGYSQAQNDSDKSDFETNYKSTGNSSIITTSNTFTAKVSGIYKLETRNTGKSFSVTTGMTVCNFVIPYTKCKIDGLEVVGGEVGDTCDLFILDTASGTLSTIPYYKVNQFGYTVNIPAGFYSREAKYEAELFVGLTISVEYTSISNKTIRFNYHLHEMKL